MIDVELKNMKTVQAKMTQIIVDLSGDPMRGAMAEATMLVTRAARKGAPRDRGTLSASIVPEVVVRTEVVTGIVGSNLKYAPYQEFGTRPFWPPWRPLFEWASRKVRVSGGVAGALAARARIAIATRGIVALRYFQSALEDNAEKIFRILGNAVGRIVSK